MVNALGKGKVKLDMFWDGSLFKARDLLPALEKGSYDLMLLPDSYATGAWPITLFTQLPGLWKDNRHLMKSMAGEDPNDPYWPGGAIRKIYDRVLADMHDIRIVAWGSNPIYNLYTTFPYSVPEDFKGKKMRAQGVTFSWMWEELGGAAVGMVSAELYEALSRGTIDGFVTPVPTIKSRKLYEVIDYCYEGNFGMDCIPFWMKNSKWQTLPDDVKAIFIEASKYYEYKFTRYQMETKPDLYAEYRAAGVEISTLSPEQAAAFEKAVKGPLQERFKEEIGPKIGMDVVDELIKAAAY